MTTSFTRTRTQIAAMVMRKLGMTNSGDTVSSADQDVIYEAIDLRLKEMHRLGIFWRKVTTVPVSFSLTASTSSASAGAGDILFPIKMTFRNGTNDDPVKILGFREYAALPNKTDTGNPEYALWKGGTEFLFAPVPLSNGTAHLLYEKIADDTSAGAAIDVDVSMIRWMKDIIAYDVADDFGKSDNTIMRYKTEAQQAELNIRKLGMQRIDTTHVAVDDFDSYPYDKTSDYGWRR